jgi:hypothetical protein
MSRAALLLLVPLVACAGARAPRDSSANVVSRDGVVRIDIRSQAVRLRIGDVLVATSTASRWRAGYDSSVFELIAPRGEEAVSNEWRLRARAEASTEIAFTGDAAALCPTPPNCPPPPSPPTIVVEVQVTR